MSFSIALVHNQAIYSHSSYSHSLNSLVGKIIKITVDPRKFCLGCAAPTKSPKGYCYKCFISLARCDLCFLAPYKCHFEQGTCREPQWALETCWSTHLIYLAFSPNPKIGLTRLSQKPKRWLDQGADWAVSLAKCSSRKDAGILEKAMFAKGWGGQSKWRELLKGQKNRLCHDSLLAQAQNDLREISQNLQITIEPVAEDPTIIKYPVSCYLDATNFCVLGTETLDIEDECTGLIGSYILLKKSGAFGFKRYEGQKIVIQGP